MTARPTRPPTPGPATPFAWERVRLSVGRVEAIAGMLFAGLIAVLVIFGGAMWVADLALYARDRDRLPVPAAAALAVAWVAAAVLEYRTIGFLRDGALFAPEPVVPSIALGQRPWPTWLRPVAAAWWLAHAGAILYVAHSAVTDLHFVNPTWVEHAVHLATVSCVMFTSAYGANTTLLLALAAARPSRRAVMRAWRWRIALDLLVAVAVPLASRGWDAGRG